MKKINTILILLVIGLTLLSCGRSQSPSTADKGSAQKTADIPETYGAEVSFFCKAKTLSNGDKIKVFITLELKKGFENLSVDKFDSRFAGSYAVLPDYGRKDYITTGSIFLTQEAVHILKPNVFSVEFSFAKPSVNQTSGLLLIEISDLQTKQKAGDELVVHFTDERIADEFAIFRPGVKIPVISNFFQSGDSVQIKNLAQDSKTFLVSHYSGNLDAASSPLAVAVKNINPFRNFKTDSSFSVSTNTTIILSKPGLYFFTKDSLKNNGITVFITDNRYPRMTHPVDLLKPLIYISSNDENRENQVTPEPKKTLDKYWLKLASGNEDIARRNIRQYYRRVTLANQLFTTYKEGWKTDMGMVFIVMGPPNKITRLKDRQLWTYSNNPNFSEINFTFMKRPNQFTENNYELIRYAEYEPIWFPAVEQWRTGSID
jgi:GWxTD domain-containing protein